jgi:hypothetical protein
MKLVILLLLTCFFSFGCGLREREQQLEKKTVEANEKEQELLLKEKSLQLKEEELAKREKLLDSSIKSAPDSFFATHPQLFGKWIVTMRCIETNCAGSAVGDTKTELWELSYQNQGIVAKAFSDDKLVRVYVGSNSGNTIKLSTEPDNEEVSSKMLVTIQDIKDNEMQGQREIIRPGDCHIVYALDFKKQ